MEKITRKLLLFIALFVASQSYAQTSGEYEYYDRIPTLSQSNTWVYDEDSQPAWITTVNSVEWTIENDDGVCTTANGGFFFGAGDVNDGSANNGKTWGTVTSPSFDANDSFILDLDFSQSNNAGFKNVVYLGFHYTYNNTSEEKCEYYVEIRLDLKQEQYTYTYKKKTQSDQDYVSYTPTATETVLCDHTPDTNIYKFTVPMPHDFNSDGHLQMSLRATGGLEVGAGGGDGSGHNVIHIYGDNLVLRDDCDNTERLTRNAGQKMKKVTIVRSYTKGWYTLCLPFDLTMKQFQRRFMYPFSKETAAANGYSWNSTSCAEIWHYDSFSPENKKMIFRKHNATNDDPDVLEAGVPYLIYIPQDISETLTDFTGTAQHDVLNPGDLYPGERVMVFTNIEVKNPNVSTSKVTCGEYEDYAFASNLGATDIADVIESNQVYYLHTDQDGENPQLYKPSSASTKIKGFRAYFISPKEAEATLPAKSLSFMNDEITAIDRLGVQLETDALIYNLQGQRVNNDRQSLSHGIYIVHGKKFVIK